jgi:hypothetical protein
MASRLSLSKQIQSLVEIILVCVRWYCTSLTDKRDLIERVQVRSISVDPSYDPSLNSGLGSEDQKADAHRRGSSSGNKVSWYSAAAEMRRANPEIFMETA